MVGVVREDAAPPPALNLAWLCGDHLPESGGVMDQDYQTITQMRKARNLYNALYRFTTARGEEIHQLTDGERKIIRALMEGGYIYSG